MKTIGILALLIIIASFNPLTAKAADWETYEMVDRLLALKKPAAPIIHENFVIFSADSSLRRVGIAFAHEYFSKVYWFTQLVVPQELLNAPIPPGKKEPDPYIDSGIQFYIYQVPDHLKELEYRLIINGLWTVDPSHNETRRDPVSGLGLSVLSFHSRKLKPNPLNGMPDGLNFTFKAEPGRTVTVGGNFNSWDPFMYELKEGPEGVYSLTVPLPPGNYQYVFFYQGKRYTDPNNPRRIYARDGSAASEITVPLIN